MNAQLSYRQLLDTSRRVNWRVDDIIGGDHRLDFSKPFLPESFARTSTLTFLSPREQLALNHIRAHGYLAMFELVERCILPFVEHHIPETIRDDDWRSAALAQFAMEEKKHIELFVRFRREFEEGFGTHCPMIGPADEIGEAVRAHSPLALAIFVLGIEWATQRHYVESVKDDAALDTQFKSLLRHHWLEESQHAKIDAMVFLEMAARATSSEIEAAVEEFLSVGAFLDVGLKSQAELDCRALEAATDRALAPADQATLLEQQHQAMRWTFLGSALVNKGFLETIGKVSPASQAMLERVAPAFC